MCRPFFRLKYRIRASTFIFPILLTAPLYTLPRFFEVESYSNNTYICLSNSSYWFNYGATSEPMNSFENVTENYLRGGSSVDNFTHSSDNYDDDSRHQLERCA